MKMSREEALDRALETLRSVRSHVVTIGGIGLQLLAQHPRALPLGHGTLATMDLDVAIRAAAPPDGDLSSLLEKAGFDWTPHGISDPPRTEYVTDTKEGRFKVEFLAQRRGGPTTRLGDEVSTTRLLGVSAALLPRLWPTLIHPWTVSQERAGTSGAWEVSVVNPASFIVQKLLSIGDRRTVAKQEKDLLQIAQAILLFGDELAELASTVDEIRTKLLPSETTIVARQVAVLGEPGVLHAGAALQARHAGAPGLSEPGRLAGMCRFGFEALKLC